VTAEVLLLGNETCPEFRECVEWLRRRTRLTCHRQVGSALEWLQSPDGATCHTLILAHERPGLFSHVDIERLHRAAPLARLIGLLGSWCEGEPRSGNPWPGVVRVYWHEFVLRAEREWSGALTMGAWRLARTATETDRVLSVAAQAVPRGHGLIAISTTSLVSYGALADACCYAGWSTTWCRQGQPPQARGVALLLWDFAAPAAAALQEFEAALHLWPHVPAVAIAGFPRHDEVAALRRAGVRHVLSKPLLIEDLLHALARICPSAAGRGAA
jgi:hypothetical protein